VNALTDWFPHAGLGLFVHWDHASQQGIGELFVDLDGDSGALVDVIAVDPA